MEFGAGRNLLTPLLLSAAGAREVHVFDIDRLATTEQVNYVIRQLTSRNHPIVKGGWREIQDLDEDLRRLYRIRYCAPADARDTRLPTDSIDFICSTSTLEHIKRDDISSILAESQRICTPNGLLSFIIDYHDHYATADPGITRFNFYRYSEKSWRWFNPPNHFQNRMRHSDYELLFDESGLTALEHRPVIPTEDFRYLDNMPMSKAFSHYSSEDLLALNGFFLLKGNQSEVTR